MSKAVIRKPAPTGPIPWQVSMNVLTTGEIVSLLALGDNLTGDIPERLKEILRARIAVTKSVVPNVQAE